MKIRDILFVSLLSTLFLSAVSLAEDVSSATATLHPTKGNSAAGVVKFSSVEGGVKVAGSISGLTPGKHGFHIHQFGDCSSLDGKSAGAHFNPENHKHGGPDSEEKHVGDLGNIEADAEGLANIEVVLPFVSLNGENNVIGRGMIVHADADDLKSQPTGAAGGRVACGVIGVAN